jgi:6,7-dimethyl-8-ribityllumazine synthase
MLRKAPRSKAPRVGGHFAIVASRYNARYVNAMVRAAQQTLRAAGVQTLRTVRVPGAYEIPVAAAWLARHHRPPLAAIICLGVILRGQTSHAQLIAEAVTQGLTQLQLQYQIPIIHEVLLLENKAQAQVRCLDPQHNRGLEAAHTALSMARLMRTLTGSPAQRQA